VAASFQLAEELSAKWKRLAAISLFFFKLCPETTREIKAKGPRT
jgi:hypothetical protein